MINPLTQYPIILERKEKKINPLPPSCLPLWPPLSSPSYDLLHYRGLLPPPYFIIDAFSFLFFLHSISCLFSSIIDDRIVAIFSISDAFLSFSYNFSFIFSCIHTAPAVVVATKKKLNGLRLLEKRVRSAPKLGKDKAEWGLIVKEKKGRGKKKKRHWRRREAAACSSARESRTKLTTNRGMEGRRSGMDVEETDKKPLNNGKKALEVEGDGRNTIISDGGKRGTAAQGHGEKTADGMEGNIGRKGTDGREGGTEEATAGAIDGGGYGRSKLQWGGKEPLNAT